MNKRGVIIAEYYKNKEVILSIIKGKKSLEEIEDLKEVN
jgi:hypothetical protein